MELIEVIPHKGCFKCGEIKPLSDFYKHTKMADGHLNKCKVCTKADVAKHRTENIEAIREYDRKRANEPHRIALRAKITKEWKVAQPKRRAAQVALGNAVRAGRVVPWPVCAIPECDCKPEAHHPDYDRPLDVVWLCTAHHRQAHATARKSNG
jgi:hypothetical protein